MVKNAPKDPKQSIVFRKKIIANIKANKKLRFMSEEQLLYFTEESVLSEHSGKTHIELSNFFKDLPLFSNIRFNPALVNYIYMQFGI